VEFVKTSIVGGVFFLLPLVILLVVVGHGLRLVQPAVEPLVARVSQTQFAGTGLVTLAAATALLLLCFVAGLVARTPAAERAVRWLEDTLLGHIPIYQMLKTTTADLAHLDHGRAISIALREADGGWQLVFVVERLEGGWSTILVPEAPNALSGSILFVRDETLRIVDVPAAKAVAIVKRGGLGAAAVAKLLGEAGAVERSA
jgi:uncharacterized membrane protein